MKYLKRFVESSIHHGWAAAFVFRSTLFAGPKTFANLRKLAGRYRRLYSTLSPFLQCDFFKIENFLLKYLNIFPLKMFW